ncbi:chemotaxis protein CheW [Sphingomonas donggukensis]|uniref:Chemotaxis protein CheW n=1 Tax=Sphingomonas donggukensis TaxID=2949093 RepID=A0ABY4TYK0_9SPHN|nr:chemotaxis protein CheW [Sphingomonas donggukensis]URW76960.1 chemotaxis protein CheW [Sphingomonas donggukensis]
MEDLYLIAHVAGRTVAIASAQVESVVDIGEVTAVPRAPDQVRGLAALRSRVVTVVDTRAALGLEGRSASGRAIIVHDEGHHYAMLVDALDDIAPFVRQPLAGGIGLSPAWRRVALGLIERDGEPVLVVDLNALIPRGLAAAA